MSHHHPLPPLRRRAARAAPAAAAIIAIAALALPALASTGSSQTNTQKALAYSRCMRSHGVTRFPDPDSSGMIPKVSLQELGVGSTQFGAAEQACQRLLPPGTLDQYPPGEVQQVLISMERFSQCMRSHGVPRWPDPRTDAQGRPIFPLPAAGISRQQARSAQTMRAAHRCGPLLPSVLPGIPIG